MTKPITVETVPWKNGVRLDGTQDGKRVCRFFVTTYDQISHYIRHIETIYQVPVHYGWEDTSPEEGT